MSSRRLLIASAAPRSAPKIPAMESMTLATVSTKPRTI
jgi:hypothetical protein